MTRVLHPPSEKIEKMKTRKFLINVIVALISFIISYLIFHNWDAIKSLF